MFTRIVRFRIKPDKVDEFILATREHASLSSAESGISRFEVMQDEGNPEAFFLIISFENDASRERHFSTDHYKSWHGTVSPWFAQSPEGATCRSALTD